jgi:hypothetical protein
MLRIVIDVLAVGLAGAAGFALGARRTATAIADRLRNDPAVGIPVMEDLAQRYGARLERHEGPPGSL